MIVEIQKNNERKKKTQQKTTWFEKILFITKY